MISHHSRLIKHHFENTNIVFEKKQIKNHIYTRHWHDFYELSVVCHGGGTENLNNNEYELKGGLISLLSPLDQHEIRVTEDTLIYVLQFNEHALEADCLDFISNLKKQNAYITDRHTLNQILTLMEIIDTQSEKSAKKILSAILFALEPYFPLQPESSPILPSVIRQAIVYLKTHFKESPKMEFVAEMFFLNKNYFCTLFKKSVGKTYTQYLLELKINYGTLLLSNTNLPIVDISMECGFGTQAEFSRAIKRYTGYTAGEYRKRSLSTY